MQSKPQSDLLAAKRPLGSLLRLLGRLLGRLLDLTVWLLRRLGQWLGEPPGQRILLLELLELLELLGRLLSPIMLT